MKDYSHTALIVVDNQKRAFKLDFWGTARSNPTYDENIIKLLATFHSIPEAHVIHVYHSSINPATPLRPSSPSMGFHPSSIPLPNEAGVSKTTNSAFVTPEIQELLIQREIWKVFFVGLSIDLCLGSTIRSVSDLTVAHHLDENGVEVKGDIVLAEDGAGAWQKKGGKFDAETIHGVHVESLRGDFARIMDTEGALKEMGRSN